MSYITQAEAQPKLWITYKYNEFKQYVLSMPYGTDILLVKVSRTHFSMNSICLGKA